MTMTNIEQHDGTTREELVQRVALMEAMIAEGRQSTARYGWMFVLWGLTYFAAIAWTVTLPYAEWAWLACIAACSVVFGVVRSRQSRVEGQIDNLRRHSLDAVWQVIGGGIILYLLAVIVSGQAKEPGYLAAVLFFNGLANGVSARILRWWPQGVSAAIWWGCGTAMLFFTTRTEELALFVTATFCGMIVFGLYAMWLERRAAALELHHA
jgi:hypothetical protein